MQRYEGEYVIRALGEEVFKGVRCKKYSYMITGPFSTYFKDKGVLAEGEETALLKLQQDLTISGTLFVDVVTGIICARAEKIQFSVVEAKRLNLTSEWITTREHIRIARERSWIIESVTTVYR